MPKSLRTMLKQLKYKHKITDTEYNALSNKLHNHDEHIRIEAIHDSLEVLNRLHSYHGIINVSFNMIEDKDVLEHLDNQSDIKAYVKQLIIDDMNRGDVNDW